MNGTTTQAVVLLAGRLEVVCSFLVSIGPRVDVMLNQIVKAIDTGHTYHSPGLPVGNIVCR